MYTQKNHNTIKQNTVQGDNYSGLVTLDYQRPQDWRVSLEIVRDPEKLYSEISLTILH